MSESYNRRCKWCGTWINMRKMPHGQWVAFEGYDTVHKCKNEKTQTYGLYYEHENTAKKVNDSSSGCLNSFLLVLALLLHIAIT